MRWPALFQYETFGLLALSFRGRSGPACSEIRHVDARCEGGRRVSTMRLRAALIGAHHLLRADAQAPSVQPHEEKRFHCASGFTHARTSCSAPCFFNGRVAPAAREAAAPARHSGRVWGLLSFSCQPEASPQDFFSFFIPPVVRSSSVPCLCLGCVHSGAACLPGPGLCYTPLR